MHARGRGFRLLLLVLALGGLLAGCAKPRAKDPDEMACEQLTVGWLESRGEREIVRDDRGVGVRRSPARVQGRLRVATQRVKAVVELQFLVYLSEGVEVRELAGGQGATHDAAVRDAFQSFAATVLGPIREACFPMPGAAPAPRLGKSSREVFVSDPVVLGTDAAAVDLSPLRAGIVAALESIQLPPGRPNWCKIVHIQRDHQGISTGVLLNNQTHPELAEVLGRLDWPRRKEDYLAKMFVVLR